MADITKRSLGELREIYTRKVQYWKGCLLGSAVDLGKRRPSKPASKEVIAKD